MIPNPFLLQKPGILKKIPGFDVFYFGILPNNFQINL